MRVSHPCREGTRLTFAIHSGISSNLFVSIALPIEQESFPSLTKLFAGGV